MCIVYVHSKKDAMASIHVAWVMLVPMYPWLGWRKHLSWILIVTLGTVRLIY